MHSSLFEKFNLVYDRELEIGANIKNIWVAPPERSALEEGPTASGPPSGSSGAAATKVRW